MDRNPLEKFAALPVLDVALRKESVDRNIVKAHFHALRRVALRKESVDRNIGGDNGRITLQKSLSARRAWIEIMAVENAGLVAGSRSPQGERG